ncbi:ABC-2 family transporter protein [Mycoplasmatota bacterium zrk1]
MEVRKNLRFVFKNIKYNILKVMEYRVSFIFQVFGMILNNGSFIIQWIILYSIKDNFDGYLFEDIMKLWAVAAGSFGINRVLFGNSIWISNLITTGKLDTYLVQPKNVLLNVITSRSSAGAIGDIIYGYIVIAIIKPDLLYILLYSFLILIGGLIHTAAIIVYQSLAFWIGRADSIAVALEQAMLMPSTYPEGLFNGIIKTILFTAIPVGFVVYMPVRILRLFEFKMVAILLIVALSSALLASLVFYRGLRRYSSSNLMIVRI